MALVLTFVYRWGRRPAEPLERGYLRHILFPVTLMIAASLLERILTRIRISGNVYVVIATLLDATFYLVAGWAVILIGNMIAEQIIASPRMRRKSLDAAMVRLGSKVVSFAVAILLVLQGARSLGVPVIPLLAGLGVGGLALALAAQTTIENFIAGLTLYADRPVRVGDFCRFGDKLGTVEEIGIRSTRIRTLEDTVLTISNADFAKQQLENFSKRGKIWYHPRISLRCETTPDQIRYLLVEIQKLLYSHPKVYRAPAYVRFAGFGTCSLDLDVFAYIAVVDYGEFLKMAEDLNLHIMELVDQAGSGLAIPTSLEYQGSGQSFNDQRAREVEAQVKEWKDKHMLHLPNFPKEKIAELADPREYPPPGSPGTNALSHGGRGTPQNPQTGDEGRGRTDE
jgi:MscS family membrane protein